MWIEAEYTDTVEGEAKHGLHSRHITVVTYAAREMMKRKSPAAAARATAKKLSGSPNIFIDGGRTAVKIDPKVLEDALWDMLVDSAVEAASKFRPEKREWAIDGTATLYNQAKAGALAPQKFAAELRRRATVRLGVDPFKPEYVVQAHDDYDTDPGEDDGAA